MALLVKRDGREYVLKVALTPEQNDRLTAEAEVLEQLRHQHIVRLYDKTDIAGHTVLVLEKAGDRTLAERLDEEKRLHVELLQRDDRPH